MHQIHVLIASFSVQIFFTVPFVCFKAISLAEWNKIGADLIVMSPPCQPFCRVGKKRDVEDERSKSFIHFLDILPRFLLQCWKKRFHLYWESFQILTRLALGLNCFDTASLYTYFDSVFLFIRLEKIPSYILLENVKGFDTSVSRDCLLKTLRELDFHIQVSSQYGFRRWSRVNCCRAI